MGDEAVEAQQSFVHRSAHRGHVIGLPFGGDAQAGLLHEGRREGEIDAARVEAGQRDFSARSEPLDQRVNQGRVARGIVDGPIVAARVLVRVHDAVAGGPCRAIGIGFPDRGRATHDSAHPGQQTPQHPVTDDKLGGRGGPRKRMARRGGERQQDRFRTGTSRDGGDPRAGHHDPGGRAAEQPAHVLIAIRTGDKDHVTGGVTGICTGLDHLTDGFVTGHQRIPHSRKGGHVPGPEQLFGPRGDAGIADFHQKIVNSQGLQRDCAERKIARGLQHDSCSLHCGSLLLSATRSAGIALSDFSDSFSVN